VGRAHSSGGPLPCQPEVVSIAPACLLPAPDPPPSHASPRCVAATHRRAPLPLRTPCPVPSAAPSGRHKRAPPMPPRLGSVLPPPSSLHSAPRAKLLPVTFLTTPPSERRPSPMIRPPHRHHPLSEVRAAVVRTPPHFPHWGSASPLPPARRMAG
jgi:hypothetical protein